MDELDRRLLLLLRANARESYTALADGVGTSEGTIRARVKRLVEEGTIRQFTIRTAGNQVKALVEVQVDSGASTQNVAAAIRSWDGVEFVWEVTGELDILVVADCPNTDDLNALIDRIRGLDGTVHTRSRLILREH